MASMKQPNAGQNEQPTYENLVLLWAQLGNIPVNEDGCLEEPFLEFGIGTDREDVWAWFEEQRPDIKVANLMGIADI